MSTKVLRAIILFRTANKNVLNTFKTMFLSGSEQKKSAEQVNPMKLS